MNKYLTIAFLLGLFVIQPTLANDYKPFPLNKTWSFPQDHGAHLDYRYEWWYFTGHLETVEKRKFGFELTFFRLGNNTSRISTGWAINNIYITHFALTNPKDNTFYYTEKNNRDSLHFAGAKENDLDVWNGNWFAKRNDNKISIFADSGKYSLNLDLMPSKPLLLQGDNGYSQKLDNPRDASYYYSFPILNGSGRIKYDGEIYTIKSISAWMDHEFFTSTYTQKIGWNWFAIQLSNNEQIMIYTLQNKYMVAGAHNSGVIYKANGEIIKLKSSDFHVQNLSTWLSPVTNVEYPSGWQLSIPQHGYEFTILPVVKNQEFISSITNYWEGKNDVTGTINGQDVTGDAYVEINPIGKDDPVPANTNTTKN